MNGVRSPDPDPPGVDPAVFTGTDTWQTLALLAAIAVATLGLALYSFVTGEGLFIGAFFLAMGLGTVSLLVRNRGLRCEITPETITFSVLGPGPTRGFSIERADVELITVSGGRTGGWVAVRRRGWKIQARHPLGRFDAAAFAEALRRQGWPVVEE